MDPIGIEENASVMLCAHRRLRIPYLCAAGIAPPLCVVLSAWTLTETIDNTDFKLNRLTKKLSLGKDVMVLHLGDVGVNIDQSKLV